MQNNFDDIRPYRDHEIPGIMKRLSENRELAAGLRQFLLPKCPSFLKPLANRIVKAYFKKKFTKVKTVKEFQKKFGVEYGVNTVAKWTSKGVTVSGLAELPADKHYLFISNHRDIVLDPAFLNAVLAWNNRDTTEIAIGDNLLMNQFVSDLIRASGSFLVKRDLPPREQLQESHRLSAYIWEALQENSVWIAQREGRAKDGDDKTNTAVIKMLYMAHKKNTEMDFPSFIKKANIVPVAISYELDPCDRLKAREIKRRRQKGSYQKRKDEDLFTILASFKGQKGRIHVAFGEPLTEEDYANAKETAAAIDRSIYIHYHQWPSNYISYDIIHKTGKYRDKYTEDEKKNFLDRFKALPQDVATIAMEGYAKSLENLEEIE